MNNALIKKHNVRSFQRFVGLREEQPNDCGLGTVVRMT
jgi:hypothetical protein